MRNGLRMFVGGNGLPSALKIVCRNLTQKKQGNTAYQLIMKFRRLPCHGGGQEVDKKTKTRQILDRL